MHWRVFKVIGVNLMVICALLAALELSFRLLDGFGDVPGTWSFSKGYAYVNPEFGWAAVPNTRASGRFVNRAGKVVYDVTYTVDQYGRRVSSRPNRARNRKALVFLGCSFTYGEGLQDDETLPANAARLLGDFNIYNYSFHGWGPGNLLKRLSQPGLEGEVRERAGAAVYLFIDSHLRRVAGNLSLLRKSPNWPATLPYFFLDDQGAPRSNGTFSSERPVRSWVFDLLARSALLSHFNIDIPAKFSDDHFTLLSKLIRDIAARLAARTAIKDFHVIFYPGSRYARVLKTYLDREGIKYIDYSDLELEKFVTHPLIPGDVHPSAEANEFLARRLVRDLGLI